MSNVILSVADDVSMLKLGEEIAIFLTPETIIYLTGCLGAGKTTLTGGILQGLGHSGPVKSPTYTLVEPYELSDIQVYHFDLYRLADPEELEYIGIREYSGSQSICLFEWPERGRGFIPLPDLEFHIDVVRAGGRQVTIKAQTPQGEKILKPFSSVGCDR